ARPVVAPVPVSEAPTPLDLSAHGIARPAAVYANLSAAALTEHIVARKEGLLTDSGAIVAYTGKRTGRSPQDRYLVAEPASKDSIAWGKVNRPMDQAVASGLHDRIRCHFQGRDVFVFDGWACADPRHRLNVRVIADKAWHTLFARCLLLRPSAEQRAKFQPELTILCAADFNAEPRMDGTRSQTC